MKILISGVFDLFHYGHMKLIKKCRQMYSNDTLIIGVHSDEECKKYKRKPILSFEERKKTIEIFGYNDGVIKSPLIETREFYNNNSIDLTIHAHSESEHSYYVDKFYSYADKNNMFVRIDYSSEISTSEIIGRI